MKQELHGIALLLFGILLVVAGLMADSVVHYPAGSLLWLAGIVVGICGLLTVFSKRD